MTIEELKPYDSVDVLGTEYDIRRSTEEEYPKLNLLDARGLCELMSKEIIINATIFDATTGKEFEMIEELEAKVVRHEILHAFFYEAGFEEYANDEDLVNALAILMPKIVKAMNELDLL